MVVGEPNINNIMGGIENTGSVRLHNHRKKLKQRFDIIKKLGQGTYGKVQLGINKETGQEVAIKTIKKSKIETEADLVRIRREIQIMSSVQHPNIIHIYEVFENREKMVLVMEYAAGGELYDYLSERKVLPEDEARRIFRQIATACYYCHKHKICHRDLKLENILLDEYGNAKIADFGLSNVFDDQRLLSTFCGSPLYASPEIVKGTPYQGPEVDCWSLGVLLYTLVYGAMPFDGSNFKRLVRQISQGDYFEPKKPSRASPLIRDMLTVNPRNRANIEKICAHWWVNEYYDESCLDISEELANQTPVRLDLLLSLAPPPPQLESEKLVVTGEAAGEPIPNPEAAIPTRSQSVGSIMELTNPAERRIKDLLIEDVKVSPKRKLESTVSTDQMNFSKDGVKRKDKIVKENTIADISLHATIDEHTALESESTASEPSLNKSLTRTISPKMDVELQEEFVDPSTQGAACTEILEDAKKIEELKNILVLPNNVQSVEHKNSILETQTNTMNKENIDTETKKEEQPKEKPRHEQSKIPAKRKPVVKKILTDKNVNVKTEQTPSHVEKSDHNEETQPPSKPVERRRSRIFETAEKFQNMIAANETNKTIPEKPKKLVIPGVNVGGYKKEFERKASLTSATPVKTNLAKKPSVEQEEQLCEFSNDTVETIEVNKDDIQEKPEANVSENLLENERRTQVKNAVNIISNALDRDGARKSKSRPCINRKPPVPFGTGGRSASANIMLPLSPLITTQEPTIQRSTPAQVIENALEEKLDEDKTSSAEITLKSATLPRRKTTKAEITLDYPTTTTKPAAMGFKTEMAHRIDAVPSSSPTQRSEAIFSVSSGNSTRPVSVEPLSNAKSKERIIPISFEKDDSEDQNEPVLSPTAKPPLTRMFSNKKPTLSQRTNSLSRQSTQDSDSESLPSTPVTGEPIRKSPREYIIPIAVEGGGYVTPRSGSLEPSDTSSTTSTLTNKSLFGRRRLYDREGSEDESPFAALHKHSSLGKDSDPEDSKRDIFRMHSLRSSRPRKTVTDHNDSFSSGEDDDDDGFEILTAENLFSTLLSRVRDLTQRINVDDRPGFPTSRLLSSHFDRGTNFWNLHNNRPDMLSRFGSIGRAKKEPSVETTATPWRRSVSRDLASDIDSVFSNPQSPTHSATLPRGDRNATKENLNINDLDLKKLKLSEEDALALSYLTPGLSRRIQKQLLSQLAPSEARKLSRTLSLRSSKENRDVPHVVRKTGDNTTLPRRFSVESSPTRFQTIDENQSKAGKSFVPIKSFIQDIPRNHLSTNSTNETSNSCLLPNKTESLLPSPDSSTSESISNKTDSSYKRYSSISSNSSLGKNVSTGSGQSSSNLLDNDRRKSSRFLRSDFYDTKDGNYYLKEKKEREMETQKVLKEIRDKRKFGFQKSLHSKEEQKKESDVLNNAISTDNLLENVSDNIKNIETNVNAVHDYVNVATENGCINEQLPCDKTIVDYVNISNPKPNVIKKERTSKIARPKSYPAENCSIASKMSSNRTIDKTQIHNQSLGQEEKQLNKNKFLQTIEKKFEKLRSFSNSPCSISSDETKSREEKRSLVDDAILRLREQSLPRNIDNCVTESGLIKRAVSVEDLTSSDPKQLQTSRKSVTKILNLFKKYEDKSSKKVEKVVKTKKAKDEKPKRAKHEEKGKRHKDDKNKMEIISKDTAVENCTIKDTVDKTAENVNKYKEKSNAKIDIDGQLEIQKTDNNKGAFSTVISNNDNENQNIPMKENLTKLVVLPLKDKKVQRPRSLMLDAVKQYQPVYNVARSDSNISAAADVKTKSSKLPMPSFRRSLNLDNNVGEQQTMHMYPEVKEVKKIPDRTNLKLDLNSYEPTQSTNNTNTGKSERFLLSPYEDDISGDSWSVCSDYRTNDLTSPVSPSSNFYSADENESVSDRIRRKSYYTRFNEKKRPRKSTLGSYRDLDLYKEMNLRKTSYGSLDRRSTSGRNYDVEESCNEYVPINHYPTYSPRVKRRSPSVYGPDYEDCSSMNGGTYSSGRNKIYNQPSRHIYRPSSPINQKATADTA